MKILVESDVSDDWDGKTDWPALAERAVRAAVAHSGWPDLSATEVSVKYTSDDEVRALNAAWRGKDKATNVLSFPQAEAHELDDAATPGPELMLGDIVLARETCAREAVEKALPLPDHAAHLLVHGTLHLLGYDHGDDETADDMEAREIRALARLGLANPYEVAA